VAVGEELRLPIAADVDVVEARQQGRALAAVAGFSSGEQTVIAAAISEIARNILMYAKKGEIILSLVQNGDRQGVAVVAIDQGPGIPADQLPFLFRPFSRVAGHEYDRETGTGLGLAISRAIVEQHHGRIWAQALPEGGSRFAFELPAAEACAAVA